MTLEEMQEKYLAECEKNKTLTEDNNNLKSVNEKLNPWKADINCKRSSSYFTNPRVYTPAQR